MNFTKVALNDVQVQERIKQVLLSKYSWPLQKSKGNFTRSLCSLVKFFSTLEEKFRISAAM